MSKMIEQFRELIAVREFSCVELVSTNAVRLLEEIDQLIADRAALMNAVKTIQWKCSHRDAAGERVRINGGDATIAAAVAVVETIETR